MLDPDQPLLEDQINEIIEEEREFTNLVDQAVRAGTVKPACGVPDSEG